MEGQALGPYRIEREIGAGGMGTVYAAAVERATAGLAVGDRVALKVVHPHLLESEGFFKRFLREAQLGRSIEHANVVRTLDADAIVQDGKALHYLVMEHVEGQTLRALADELRVVPEELCRHVALEICHGLAAVHAAGVVHRDLKPDNVILTPDHQVKVMDLGVAQLTEELLRLSATGAFVGSVEYAAPEQFRADEVSAATDLHALGLMLYELASGVHPYRADDFRSAMHRICSEEPRRLGRIQPQVSALFEELVHTLLAKEPRDRFASSNDVARVLEEGEESAWWRRRAREIRAVTRSPIRRVRVPRETAVYGRDDEIALLRDRFARAARAEGQVVLIEGEAGIGKTRLVDELIDQLHRDGEELHFLFASYPPGGAATATGAFSKAFREQLGDEGSEDLLTQTPGLVPAFDAVLRGEPLPRGAAPLRRDALQACFVHATRGLAESKTTVLLIDDLHFAPEEALSLFAAVAMGVADHRVLLIGTSRRGLSERWIGSITRLDHATHVPLTRLGPKDLVRLLRDSFHSESSAQLLSAQIALKSDGNPFFVFEIIRGLREGQFLTKQDDGSWVSTAVIEEIEIPSSVLDLVNARVAPLDESDRDLLDVAACCGFEFDPLLVARALDLEVIPTLKTLRRIEQRHRLVRAAGRRFVFDHHQVQEWLYRGLPDLLRENYHALIGSALEETIPEGERGTRADATSVELAEHFLRGGQGERAKPYVDAALRHLESGYILAHAARLAKRALDIDGLYVDGARFDLLYERAKWLSLLGHRDEEAAASDEALALAERLGDGERHVRALLAQASRLGNTAQFDACAEVTLRALKLAEEAGLERLRAGLLRFMGTVSSRRARYDDARRYLRECLDWCVVNDARDIEISAENSLGSVESDLGNYDEARRHLEHSLSLAQEAGDVVDQAIALGDLGVTYHELGLLDLARQHYEQCHELFVQSADRYGEANALANLGDLNFVLGDAARARDQLDAAAGLAREIGYEPLVSFRDMCLGTAATDDGRVDAAERLLTPALEQTRRWAPARDVSAAEVDLAELRLAQGRIDDARTHLDKAIELATPSGAKNALILAHSVATRLPGADPSQAVRMLAEEGCRMRALDRMRSYYSLWLGTGVRTHAESALAELEHLRDNAPERHRQSIVDDVPLHRAIVAACRDDHGTTPESPTLAG
jgi:predicted ATPase